MSEPNWQKNLRDAVVLNPLVIAHGNVKDIFAVSADRTSTLPMHLRAQPFVRFDVWLALEFERLGYPVVVLYDPVDGTVALRPEMAAQFQRLASQSRSSPASATPTPAPVSGPQSTALPALPEATKTAAPAGGSENWLAPLATRQDPNAFFRVLYENVLQNSSTPVAVICRHTDRFLSYTDRQSTDERQLSMLIQKAAMSIPAHSGDAALASRIVLIFNLEGETPQEINVQAPFTHSILVPPPTVEEREDFFRFAYSLFDPGDVSDRFDPESDPVNLRLVANLADGLKMQDLFSLIALSRRERLGLGKSQVKTLLDRFRFGTRENAWLKVKPESLRDAKQILSKRVKGQDEVLEEVVPVLIRAKLGMSDSGGTQYSSRPRGSFFFVGPTGVGKTELSKAIAELVFGDEKALLRFDMSEYSEEHQQARLIGAPPGYVGFDQGGQLTNAISERPFSVVLFDEIEKAHGRILDKFLQILDDGRLTDGMGRTVYFSEAILIFTSNLGTAPRTSGSGRAGEGVALLESVGGSRMSEVYSQLAALAYDDLCNHFRREVKDFFVNRLGRPEILNRIGEENVLVFKFLTDPDTKAKIVDQQIAVMSQMLQETHQVGLFCTRSFKRLLISHPNGFERNGARGVRNLLSRFVLNPLAEQLFLQPDACHGKTFHVDYQMAQDRIAETPFDRKALHYEWLLP